MDTDVLQLRTGARPVTDITEVITQFCRDRGDGLCHVFVPHATAGVALIEIGSGSESDLEDAIDRLLPKDDIYRHQHGSRGHGRDHVLPANPRACVRTRPWRRPDDLPPPRSQRRRLPAHSPPGSRRGKPFQGRAAR